MRSVASLSAAAVAASVTSSTALSVAVTCAARPPRWATPGALRVSRLGRSAIPPLVQAAFRDVLHNPIRDQVPDRLALRDPLPARGGRDRQRRYLHQADLVNRQAGPAQPVPGTRASHEVRQLEQLISVLPRHQLAQRVSAG